MADGVPATPPRNPQRSCAFSSPSGDAQTIDRLLAAKAQSGKTLHQIGIEAHITNSYCGQLFLRQTPLLSAAVAKRLRAAVPALTAEDVARMRVIPERGVADAAAGVKLEPVERRLREIVGQYAETVKMYVHEELGDGVMSAEDVWMSFEKAEGLSGEDRVVITFDGCFVPVIEQHSRRTRM
ncbi:hypothetical protein BU14_0418s0002 [Porphyra umbilicalis]|uniref:Cyanate lyase C-terminal domain-containing protein n=1 Tax=Porphyra umbilicalis TaxID=2786 RepID=A0A1X6NW67_PORUM|nr:hypothetical protein BU14_0418s0002 [Porphyra umbilicalis]|eukprot:OSX72613.1 hypothetical protein BU14_0418s0002 [Porphyra umbilicalis]